MPTRAIESAVSGLPAGDQFRALIESLAGTRVHTLLTRESVLAIPTAIGVLLMVLLHIAVLGRMARKILCLKLVTRSGTVGVTLALGFALFGFLLWLLGSVHALRPVTFALSTPACLMVIAFQKGFRADALKLLATTADAIRRHRAYSALCGLLISCAFISGLRPPVVDFDDDYHWQTATLWAESGHWVTSPYRLTNGPALGEMYFSIGALFGSPTAAHWTATLATLVLAISAAGIAARAGVPAIPSMAAVLSIPVLGNHASLLLNDAMTTLFTVSAFAALWCATADSLRSSRSVVISIGLLLSGALSCKFLALAALPAICVLLICRLRKERANPRAVLVSLFWLLLPVVLAGVLWTAHTYTRIGKLRDDSGQYMARSPDDVYWTTGAAAGRIPTMRDILRLPIDLVQTTIWGQKEPYGGRTGALLLIFVPIGLLMKKRDGSDARQISREMLLSGLSFFFLLGPIALKTRFHLPAFVLLTLFSAIAWHHSRQRAGWRLVVDVLFFALIAVGMLDGIRKQMMGIFLEVPPS